MDSNRFIVSKEFDGFAGGAINKVYDKQAIISNENVSIFYIDSFLVVKLNNKVFFFDCTLYVDKWLGFVINYSAKFNQLAVFVYDNFVNIYSKVLNNIEIFTFNSEDIYLISGKYKLTNIEEVDNSIQSLYSVTSGTPSVTGSGEFINNIIK